MQHDRSCIRVDRRFVLVTGGGLLASAGAGFAQDLSQNGVRPNRTTADLIATFVAGFDIDKAPPELIERARIAFVDTIGVMLGGAHEEVAHIARDMVAAEASAPRASIPGSALRASPQLAALANGVAAHAMDSDFSYASGQSASPVIPALLPLAEATGATPKEVIAAFIVGCEVAARLVRASPKISAQGGWHAVGMIGPIAAAAACARLLKLPPSAIPDVIGISASLASGFSANFGTMTKPLHSGNAARNAIMAAMLGAKKFTASATALEGRSGYFDTFSRGLPRVDGAFNDLGATFDLLERGYKLKRYPCGGLSHASIDAALKLREQIGGGSGNIAKVEVGVTSNAFQRIGAAYPHSVESAKFSMPYIASWTTLYGAPSLATFTEQAIADPRIKTFAPKISHHIDPEFADEIDEAPGRVKVTLVDGKVLEQKVWFASGTPQNPMSSAQIEAKFMDCAKLVMKEEQARRVFTWVGDLPEQRSFDALWPMLRVG